MRWSFDDVLFSREPVKGCIRTGVNTPSSLLRRSKFEEVGGFDQEHRCWEDGDMHLRLALAGAQFRAIPDVLSFGIRHKRGTSGSDLYCHRCRLDFLEKYAGYVPRIPAQDLVEELVLNATRLYREGDKSNAMRALDLAGRLGWKGPQSRHPALALLAKLPSARLRKMLFAVQARARGSIAVSGDERAQAGGQMWYSAR
jgi:GT2 family glycosyltransferase